MLKQNKFTLIDEAQILQTSRYRLVTDSEIIEEERKSVYYCLKDKRFKTIEEEWAFRNGFVFRKNYGRPYFRMLREECILLCNYKCQGNEQGKYHVEFNDDLGDEEEGVMKKGLDKFNYTSHEEVYAFKCGFIARRKFGTRYLEFQNKYGRLYRNKFSDFEN